MLYKISDIVKRMEKAGINDNNIVISKILSSHTKKVDLAEITEGNPNNLTEEKLMKILNKEYEKETDNYHQQQKWRNVLLRK